MTVSALVVGSLVMDLAFRVDHRPQPGEIVVADHFDQYLGGKGYNQAVALARLGAEVTMVGAVGADAYGDAFIASLEREGIDSGRVVQLRGATTAVAVPVVTPDGEAGFVHYPGANLQLSAAHCADLPDCDVLLLQGEANAYASEQAAKVIGRRGGIVVLKPAPVTEISPALLDATTVVCPNEVEARALAADAGALTGGGDVELARALRTEDRAAVVTLGGRGAAYAVGDDAERVDPPAVPVADTTSAGDAFCAALAVRLAEGASYPEAVRFACAAGAHAVTVEGAEPSLPTRAQVESLLAEA